MEYGQRVPHWQHQLASLAKETDTNLRSLGRVSRDHYQVQARRARSTQRRSRWHRARHFVLRWRRWALHWARCGAARSRTVQRECVARHDARSQAFPSSRGTSRTTDALYMLPLGAGGGTEQLSATRAELTSLLSAVQASV